MAEMEKIKLKIANLSYSQTQTGAYVLVMGEEKGKRRLPIIIGGYEAQAIAIEIEKMTPSRPLTHDLFKNFAEEFKIEVKEIVIYNLIEGIFFSKILCVQNNQSVEIDARTSDAVALAVRFGCPIYTYEFILSSAGIVLDKEKGIEESKIATEELDKPKKSKTEKYTLEELEDQLEAAINNEDYEKASRIRDEITKRRKIN
jgi:uncharacterized protein